MRVTNGIPLGCPLILPVGTVNCVQPLKVSTKHGGLIAGVGVPDNPHGSTYQDIEAYWPVYPVRTVRVFRQEFTLEDAIEFHAFAPLQASSRVTNDIPLGWPPFLPVHLKRAGV
jgi:hypothetical protein